MADDVAVAAGFAILILDIFHFAAGRISYFFRRWFPEQRSSIHPIISLGFWPGGDRDGNPFVNVEITRKVAQALRSSIIKCYYLDVRKLKRRLTFKGIEGILNGLEAKL